jgi:hypothetical protein
MRFIVGEVSKNWSRLVPHNGTFLCQQFEELIATNLARGYVLHQFQLHRLMTDPGEMNETIVAVFERLGPGPEVN